MRLHGTNIRDLSHTVHAENAAKGVPFCWVGSMGYCSAYLAVLVEAEDLTEEGEPREDAYPQNVPSYNRGTK